MKKRKHVKRWLWLLAGVAAIAVIVWALWPRPVEIETTRAERGALAATVSGEGRTRVIQLYVVASPVDGELERVALQTEIPSNRPRRSRGSGRSRHGRSIPALAPMPQPPPISRAPQ
jgi:hypothetical protein